MPVRRHQLSHLDELRLTVELFALNFPGIAFEYKVHQCVLFSVSLVSNQISFQEQIDLRFKELFEWKKENRLVFHQTSLFSLYGFCSASPCMNKHQYIFINHRYITNSIIYDWAQKCLETSVFVLHWILKESEFVLLQKEALVYELELKVITFSLKNSIHPMF